MASLAPRSLRAVAPLPPASVGASGIALAQKTPLGTRGAGQLVLQGKYRLDAPLAVGGMGSVWSATHVTLERRVAVKFVDLSANDPNVLERFLREARLAASIHHPHVVDVVDFGIAESGEPVLVMELLEGETLAERMERTIPLSTDEIVEVMAQILEALDAVHRAGILHSDMKPENVMLDVSASAGLFARLIDFGIAFSIDPASQHRRSVIAMPTVVNGTPEYMPPEQAEGRPDLDVRTDVYAASVMLYELLSGVSPFFDPQPGVVLHKVIEGSHTPLLELRPDLPEIAAVVASGMAHDRASRPPTARELRRLLLAAASQARLHPTEPDRVIAQAVPADPVDEVRPRSRARMNGLAALLVLSIGGALAVTGWPTPPRETPMESPPEIPIGESPSIEPPFIEPPFIEPPPPLEAPPPSEEPPMIDPVPDTEPLPRPHPPRPNPSPDPEPTTPSAPYPEVSSPFLDDPGF